MGESQTAAHRYDQGLDVLRRICGGRLPDALKDLDVISPDFSRLMVEFAYGDVHTRPGLDLRRRELATVAALTALGHVQQLTFYVEGALNVGCTRREIVETIIHTCIYAGFPAALNGLFAAKEVFAGRPEGAGEDLSQPSAPDGTDRFARGWAALTEIDGAAGEQVFAALQDIAPDLARYIVEFSFGDIYSRGGLDLRTREIVTVAACTALGTARPQLKVHIHGLLNVGGTTTDVLETILQMAVYAGFPAALNGILVAGEVFQERGVRTGTSAGTPAGTQAEKESAAH